MLIAKDIRATNDHLDIIKTVFVGALQPGNLVLFPVRPSFEPRPVSDDDFAMETGEGGLQRIARKGKGPSRTQDADLIRVETGQSLCNACASALGYLARYLEQKTSVANFYEKKDRLAPNVVLHWNLLSLLHSDVRGCHLCSLIRAHIELEFFLCLEFLKNSRIELVLDSNLEYVDSSTSKPPEASTDAVEHMYLACALAYNPEPERTEKNYKQIFKLRLWPSPKHDALFMRELPADDISSSSRLEVMPRGSSMRCAKDMAVNWLDQCRRNCNGEHDTCIAKDPLWLPTRLLDLSHANPGGSVPVVSRENRPELFAAHHEYITLSHCWGDWREAGLPRLLEENKDQYEREGVLFDDLPPLLRDAMEIAQWFNVRWLWMDSLCIVQDSPSMADWNREAPLMCKVYKHGLLNISADASDDARSGCLHDRPAAQVTPFKLQMANLQRSWWVATDEHDIFKWIAKAPLSQRAWVFQERHLARRALHLTKHEVLWECCPAKPYIACETYAASLPFDNSRFFGVGAYERVSLSTGHDQKARHRAWLDLCEDYSARALSFEKDRLPALAGLAAEFADLIPEDRYVVGFWSSALPAVLLWSSKRRVRQKGVRAAYVAPSWSWLSSCSAVRFDTETDTSIQHIIANVIDINVTPSTPSPFAMVQPGASIELRGFVRFIRVVRTRLPRDPKTDKWYMPQQSHKQRLFVDGSERGYDDNAIMFLNQLSWHLDAWDDAGDEDGESKQGDALKESTEWSGYCLLVAVFGDRQNEHLALQGLLLDKTDSPGVFQRAGRITFSGFMALPIAFKMGDIKTSRLTSKIATLFKHSKRRLGSQTPRPTDKTKESQPEGSRHEPSDDKDSTQSGGHDDSGPMSLYDFYQGPTDRSFTKLSCRTIKIV